MNGLRSHIKNSKESFIRYPNTSKSVKKTRLRLVFSAHFSGFGYPDETLFLLFDILHEIWSFVFDYSSICEGFFNRRHKGKKVKKDILLHESEDTNGILMKNLTSTTTFLPLTVKFSKVNTDCFINNEIEWDNIIACTCTEL